GFWDPPSVAIVLGGTIGAVIFNFPLSVLTKVPKMLKIAFLTKKYDPDKYIDEMVDYCKTARMKGILALEESANACPDPFMKASLMLIVYANDSDKVQSMLDDSINFICERHENNYALWSKASAVAPALGMIGTLIGLINMLAGLDPSDPNSAATLGQGMSTALVTTFYGCILAHLIFTPIGNLCKYNHNQEVLCLQIIEEGTLAIISGANPRYVEEKLRMMLPSTHKPKKNNAPASEGE
ncbi:MAG: MotA/TolQ/ExbB proton channel family protein, partial [Oscillospiraceae bacterium]|nr:MotA/TolQ/ExbB proton channel family protein [Oscillospiraceae bacterium]